MLSTRARTLALHCHGTTGWLCVTVTGLTLCPGPQWHAAAPQGARTHPHPRAGKEPGQAQASYLLNR